MFISDYLYENKIRKILINFSSLLVVFEEAAPSKSKEKREY